MMSHDTDVFLFLWYDYNWLSTLMRAALLRLRSINSLLDALAKTVFNVATNCCCSWTDSVLSLLLINHNNSKFLLLLFKKASLFWSPKIRTTVSATSALLTVSLGVNWIVTSLSHCTVAALAMICTSCVRVIGASIFGNVNVPLAVGLSRSLMTPRLIASLM